MSYRNPPLEIPSSNPFQNDVLDRRKMVEFIAKFIEKVDGPFVLTLDSPWGTGKTTIVKMLEVVLKNKKYCCIYFNAWQIDYVTDPLVALVSAIDQLKTENTKNASLFKKHVGKVKKVTTLIAKRTAVTAAKAITLGSLDLDVEIENAVSELSKDSLNDIVDAFQKERTLLEKFRTELESAVNSLKTADKEPKLIFFIDEIDRCRPSFAIELLERIKHLFDVPNIIFVLSMDKAQLQSGISAVYGHDINSLEYLRRFIDLEYSIPQPKTKLFVEHLLHSFGLDEIFARRSKNSKLQYDKSNFIDMFSFLANAMSLSLRSQERCITRLKVVMDQTSDTNFLIADLTALLIVLRNSKPELYLALCSGKIGARDIMDFLNSLQNTQKVDSYIHPLIFVEAYLIVLDKDEVRAKSYLDNLKAQLENEKKLNLEDTRTSRLLELITHIRRDISVRFDYISNKIDFASNLN